MAKTETKTAKTATKKTAVKKETAPLKKIDEQAEEDIVIETIEIPEEIASTKIDMSVLETEELKEVQKIQEKFNESQEKFNEVLSKNNAEEAKQTIEEEIEKMKEVKKDLEKLSNKVQYTSLWNGINFNL